MRFMFLLTCLFAISASVRSEPSPLAPVILSISDIEPYSDAKGNLFILFNETVKSCAKLTKSHVFVKPETEQLFGHLYAQHEFKGNSIFENGCTEVTIRHCLADVSQNREYHLLARIENEHEWSKTFVKPFKLGRQNDYRLRRIECQTSIVENENENEDRSASLDSVRSRSTFAAFDRNDRNSIFS